MRWHHLSELVGVSSAKSWDDAKTELPPQESESKVAKTPPSASVSSGVPRIEAREESPPKIYVLFLALFREVSADRPLNYTETAKRLELTTAAGRHLA